MNKNSARKPAVYALSVYGGFFYIGKTQTNIQERFWQHTYRARSGHQAPVYVYMREVGISNVEIVELELIEDWNNSSELETKWITDLLNSGYNLTNQLGIDGIPDSWSDTMKQKMSALQKGRETWIKGRTGEDAGWTEERRVAQSQRRKGNYKHGAKSAALTYRCTCGECEAYRIDYYAKIESKKAKNTHGTVAKYKHGKCRCPECKAAYSEYQKRFYTPKSQ